MSTITNYDYLLRNYYSSNRLARKSYNRVNMKSSELASADSAAIKKVAKTLKDMEYNSDNGVSIYNNVKAFVDTYNNLSENADKDPTMSKYWKRLKKVIKDNSSDLEDIGISIKSSGKLEVDKTKLVSCSPAKVGKVLSGDNTITESVMDYAARIQRSAKALVNSKNTSMEKNSSTSSIQNNTQAFTSLLADPEVVSPTSINIRA